MCNFITMTWRSGNDHRSIVWLQKKLPGRLMFFYICELNKVEIIGIIFNTMFSYPPLNQRPKFGKLCAHWKFSEIHVCRYHFCTEAFNFICVKFIFIDWIWLTVTDHFTKSKWSDAFPRYQILIMMVYWTTKNWMTSRWDGTNYHYLS